MRHQKAGRKLNRNAPQRKALFKSLSIALIEHGTIKTTVAKAKELRRYVEPLVTLAKEDSVANRRQAFAFLRNKQAVAKLFNDLGPQYVSRPGGYTRVLKCGFRAGDAAPMAYIQFVQDEQE